MFYTGIDLYKDNCFIKTIDAAGNIVYQNIYQTMKQKF